MDHDFFNVKVEIYDNFIGTIQFKILALLGRFVKFAIYVILWSEKTTPAS